MLSKQTTYEAAVDSFRWAIPEHYNIGVDVCDKWAASRPDDAALIHEHRDGSIERMTFAELRSQSNRAANCFRAHGIVQGSRVAILIAQSPQTAIAHIAAFKLGAISVPLFALFGEEALEFRLRDSEQRARDRCRGRAKDRRHP